MYPFTPPPPPRHALSWGALVLIGAVLLLILLTIGALLREASDARTTTAAALPSSASDGRDVVPVGPRTRSLYVPERASAAPLRPDTPATAITVDDGAFAVAHDAPHAADDGA
jgi:hypothetical protein